MNLTDDISCVKGIGPKRAAALKRLGIANVYDMITYYPRTYIDQSKITKLDELKAGDNATVMGYITNVSERAARRNISILNVIISDGTGFLSIVFFNQSFLKKNLISGKKILATGKIDYAYRSSNTFQMSSISLFEIMDADGATRHGVIPVYSATASLNQKFFRKAIQQILDDVPHFDEVTPESIRKIYGLMGRDDAMREIHFPKSIEALKKARERLAFDELYIIQCGLLIIRKKNETEAHGIRHLMNSRLVNKIYASLPFALTQDQERTWREIVSDMEKATPMRRLVQGDVGSGKTVIALLALVKTVENGYQGVLMAPTEILARQHFDTFTEMLKGTGIRLGFLSGHLSAKEHQTMIDAVASHDVDVIIGTHALIQDKVRYDALGLVVTDEQHRFGIDQRATLTKKGTTDVMPDLLVMTATPIPRTMALTVYGDLSVSRIESMPPGRKPIRTFVRTKDRRRLIYEYVHKEIASGRQAYVVCPLIEDSENSGLLSAEAIYAELSGGIFHDVKCGLVHGKLKSKDKEAVMASFYNGETKLLVATTVIEVGVNVPNATIMVVENAERFGLSQLHQLRGRIGRGEYRSFCILVMGHETAIARERLSIMERVSSGFELAEEDLRLRGPGQFFGSMQHGIGDLKIANVLRDTDILMKAREAAKVTISDAATLSFMKKLLSLKYKEHFEHINDT